MSETSTGRRLLEVQNLRTCFKVDDGDEVKSIAAVNDVSFHIDEGEVLGLVGESGCGKSVTSLSIMRLIGEQGDHGWIDGGKILFREGDEMIDLRTLDKGDMRRIRGNRISMIFQEPMTSLNPVFTVGDQIAEAIVLHQGLSKAAALKEATRLLDEVQIPDPGKRVHEYPHQMSGGMRQRVMIAMALSCNPSLIIADEPTTALDVTIQAQILDILRARSRDRNLAVLLITHDLGVVAEMAARVAVMYTGKVVEEAPVEDLFKAPKHPYTRGLLRSVPNPDRELAHGDQRHRLETIPGMVPDLLKLPSGCTFRDRCIDAEGLEGRCAGEWPELYDIDERRVARCYLYA